MKTSVSVLGSGSWGTALAISLAQKGYKIKLWGRNQELQKILREKKENVKYLPGIILPENIEIIDCLEEAVDGIDVMVLSIASQGTREVLRKIKNIVPKNCIIVNTAKGIDKDSLSTLSVVAKEELPQNPFVTLSGPSHAEEVSKGMPTTLVSSSSRKSDAESIQDLFMSPRLRVYTNPDILGVEVGGAFKNIIALAAGISDGLGFGDNAKAALMTRGIVEISRLGVEMGAQISTFSGLSGIGDLIVTCTSMHSRNRKCGILIGQGMLPERAIKEIGMVVEGIYAVDAAYKLSKRFGVEMPITEELFNLLHNKKEVRASVMHLMTRQKKHEMEENAADGLWQ